jgi:hypothetical protein
MLNKNIIKDALADAKEIEKFAIEQARKSLEEALMPQIEKAIQDSLQENTTVESIEENEIETITISESVESSDNLISENTNSQNIQEMYNEKEETNEELFEVEGLFEDEETAQEPTEASLEAKLDAMTAKLDTLIAAAQGGGEEEASAEGEVEVVDDEAAEAPAAPAPAEPAAAAPAPAAPAAPAPAEQPTVTEDTMFEIEMEEDMEEGLFEMEEDMEEGMEEGDKVYEINVEEDMEEGLYEIDMEEDMEEAIKKEGEMEEEGLYEIDMEEDMEEGWKKVEEDMEEEGMFEVEMEEEGENLEEKNYGGSFTSINRAGNNARKERLPMHAPMNESKKIKAQYESKLDELIKENASLKGVIKNYKSNLKEFENSFVELKSQLNEMQTFNGKLAYANKLLTKGGLTNDEKIRIAEEFDKCATVEDAKKLYNKIISENKFSSKSNTDKLKSVKPSTAPVQNLSESKAEKLFESEERRRMKMLAGIVKPIN